MEKMALMKPGPRPAMTDGHGRHINYLRLSITDLCNLRCFYCMPRGGVEKLPHEDILRFEEQLEIARAAVDLGVTKIRITGGEPLIKRGAVKIVREIASWSEVKTVAMTTNGTRLAKYAEVLRQVGLDRLNISLDSLNPEVYSRITRGGRLERVLEGIDKALESGFPVKINAVLIPEQNVASLTDLVEFARDKGVEVRFIERMSFEKNAPFLSQDEVIAELEKSYAMDELPTRGGSPHVRLFDCDGARIGFISPRSRPFCSGCNKIRLTPMGELRACLASKAHVDLRAVLRRPHTEEDVRRAIREAVALKPELGPWTTRSEMWRVGG